MRLKYPERRTERLPRTHKKELGASSFGSNSFKLVNISSPDQILAVYISDRQWLNTTDVARIEFMVELGSELELTSLAAVLGIAETVRRTSRNATAAGAGGAAAC